jgi:hypothetical protein
LRPSDPDETGHAPLHPQRRFFCVRKEPSMAFAIRNLSVLAYANGFTLWHYRGGTERLADIRTDTFFGDAADMLASGDILMVSAAEGAQILCVAGLAAGPGAAAKPAGVTLARLA